MDMLKIVLYSVLLLGEIFVCLVGVKHRVQDKYRILSTIMAIAAMLAFFVTVAYISTPNCNWHLNGVVCPAN